MSQYAVNMFQSKISNFIYVVLRLKLINYAEYRLFNEHKVKPLYKKIMWGLD